MPHYSMLALHSAVTHFPIAMLIAALLFELGSPIFKKPEWRMVSFWLLVTAVVTAPISLITGIKTADHLLAQGGVAAHVMQQHRLYAFVASGLALIILAWRIAVKDRLAKGAIALSLVLTLFAVAAVGYTGYLGGRMILGEDSPIEITPSATAPAPVVKEDPGIVLVGRHLYETQSCSACHRLNGQGGAGGPDLSHEGLKHPSKDWQIAHLKDPGKATPGSTMPAYDTLTVDQLNALASYLVTRT